MNSESELNDIIMLGAVDGIYYSHQWFPKTVRQSSPEFHKIVWQTLDDPENPFVALEMFRGSAKTTIMRLYISKRIAYGLSRTILLVGPEQKHPKRSLRWLKKQVEVNTAWASTFGLKKGSKWSEEEIEIINETSDCAIHVTALGMTGSTRGLNLDDYRPDFIGVDDPCDEENTGTDDQIEKTDALFFGGLQQGLAPRSEAPHAKMVLLQTSLAKKDLINKCHSDPTWKTVKLSVFDKHGQSVWEERFPTKELIKSKQAFISRNQIHYWLREMECKIVSAETAAFNTKLLKFYKYLPESMQVFVGVDPARETKLRTRAHKAAIVAVGVASGIAYLLEYWAEKNQNPEAIWQAYSTICLNWRPLMTGVESVAYQQTLAWYFQQRRVQTNMFIGAIKEVYDKRKKPDRIRQAFTGRLSQGTFQVKQTQTEFIEALTEYTDDVDIDVLDAGAIALDLASPFMHRSLFGDSDGSLLPVPHEEGFERGEFVAPCP